MHKTLERQLNKIYGSAENIPANLNKIIEQISKTYEYYENDHDLIERSLEVSSKELTTLLESMTKTKEEIEKKVEKRTIELAQEKDKLDKVAQNMNVGAILLDRESKTLFVNHFAKEVLGIKGNDLSNTLEIFYKKFADFPAKEYLKKCTEDNPLEIPEIEVADVIYKITFRCLESNNETYGYLIWIRDITDEKLLERSKSELIAVASHQLRTPLTVTKGNTEMLLDEDQGKLNEDQKTILHQIYEANNNLIKLVNEMLDITKIEGDKLDMNIIEIDIDKIIKEIIDVLQGYAKRHGITLCYNEPKVEIPFIKGDETLIKQILQNILENSIRYTRPTNKEICNVDIDIVIMEKNITLSIKDHGIGIPLAEQTKVFTRFYRATNAVKFASSGTGLGLYIAKSILEKLGGKIWFNSKEGIGTTFFIEFPINTQKG